MKSVLPAGAVALGVVLLAASAAWAILFPASRAWTPEKSARLTQVGNECSAIKLQLNKPGKPSTKPGEAPAELKAKFEQLDAEYKQLYLEFSGATESPKKAKRFLWWSGIAFVVAGGLIVFATREGS
jgi:hypothetical protein